MNKGPYRILIVDDCPEDRETYRRLIHRASAHHQHQITEAETGEDALLRCASEAPDCVLLDYNLPDLDGLEFLTRLRSDGGNGRIAVIVLTGNGSESIAVQSLKHGAQDYLVKGQVTPNGLLHVIHSAIETTGLQHQIEQQRHDLERQNVTLRHREELFRLFMENVPAAVAMVDVDMRYLSVSNRWLMDYGLTGQDIHGKCHYEVFPEIPERWKDIHRRCLTGLVERADEEEFVRADGSVQWLRWEVRPWFTVHDSIGGIIIFSEDITERKQAEISLRESEERFALFMQHLPGLAWIKDLEGRYLYVNDAAEKAFGTPREQLYGKTDSDLFCTATAAQFFENDQCALASPSGIVVVESLKQPDSVLHHAIVSKFPITGLHGRAILLGGMAIDITALKQAEDALREADRRKDEFLAMLAHELRNPLAPIRNAAYVMAQLQLKDPKLQWVHRIIEQQVSQLSRLVNDLLDVSRIVRGKISLKLETLDLVELVRQAVETVAPLIESRRHRLHLRLPENPVRMAGDTVRLTQVLVNLLDNAAKYTPEGGQIDIEIDRQDHLVEIRIRDDGVGISGELLPHVFDLFQQGERTLDRTQGGLGLGLTLVKRLVQLHGGQVKVASDGPDRGSTFTIRLPTPPMPYPAKIPVQAPAHIEAACKVLVVDDDPDVAESTAMLLQLAGHEVKTAPDGETALHLATDSRPQVVLIDIGLAGMDGYEVARRLRARADGASLFLVAVSGYGHEQARIHAQQAGFDLHLVKPVPPQDLCALVDAQAERLAERL